MSNLNLQKLREWVWPWPWTFKWKYKNRSRKPKQRSTPVRADTTYIAVNANAHGRKTRPGMAEF